MCNGKHISVSDAFDVMYSHLLSLGQYFGTGPPRPNLSYPGTFFFLNRIISSDQRGGCHQSEADLLNSRCYIYWKRIQSERERETDRQIDRPCRQRKAINPSQKRWDGVNNVMFLLLSRVFPMSWHSRDNRRSNQVNQDVCISCTEMPETLAAQSG